MVKPILDDELWKLAEPLIPKKRRRYRYPGRKPVPDRAVLTGIFFVLMTGIGWEHPVLVRFLINLYGLMPMSSQFRL